MLTTLDPATQIGNRWERTQQPVHGTANKADHLRLLAALDEGWQIMEAAEFLAHGSNTEGRGYLLKLLHPHRLLTCEWTVMRSPEIDSLLAHEHVPMAE